MPNGTDVVNVASAALHIPGVHYGADDCPDRCHPDHSPHCVDCSGLTSYVQNLLGLNVGCEGSFHESIRCHQAGTGMSIEEAFRTPGALLFQGINEGQGGIPGKDPGHVGFSVGDNEHTLEARGHWSGVGLFVARSLIWTYAAMPPGVAKVGTGTPGQHPSSTLPPYAMEETDMTMLVLPNVPGVTIKGRVPTARPIKNFNFVILEDGARLVGDIPVKAGDPQRHWWAPPAAAQVPGATIVDIADMRPNFRGIAVRYGYPNGDSGTYIAELQPAN